MKYDRRELFKTFGASALFLHPILSSREGWAQEADMKRLLVFHTSSGVINANWWPKGTPAAYDLMGTSLEPLNPFKSDINIIRGLTGHHNQWDAHSSGLVNLMTGFPVLNEKCDNNTCDTIQENKFARAASFDQILAEKWKGKTAVPSLVLGILPKRERPSAYLSYGADGRYIPQARDPYTVFKTLFRDILKCTAGGKDDDQKLALLKTRRKSILDAISGDLKDVARISQLSAPEVAKFNLYVDSVRQMEANLNNMGGEEGVQVACTTLKHFLSEPAIPVNDTNYPKVARMMMDLIVAAFQMDITRIATVTWSVGGADGVPSSWANFNGKPIQESYHALSHGMVDPTNWREKLTILDRYHAGEFAYIIGKLKESTVGNSNILDNSLALWASEISDGNTHSSFNLPIVLAGKAGGAIKSGKFIELSPGDAQPLFPHQNLMVSMMQALGQTSFTSWGDTKFTQGRAVNTGVKLT
ncbi:MAG: DUF1552 domain-containing protein [Bdellovibrionota bacterium]